MIINPYLAAVNFNATSENNTLLHNMVLIAYIIIIAYVTLLYTLCCKKPNSLAIRGFSNTLYITLHCAFVGIQDMVLQKGTIVKAVAS